jgi:hypothetical protein
MSAVFEDSAHDTNSVDLLTHASIHHASAAFPSVARPFPAGSWPNASVQKLSSS